MDPADRTLRARLAAHTSWANTPDPASRTEKARAAFAQRFVKQAREKYPDGSDELIQRTAGHLMQAHMTRMGMKSGAKRRKGAVKDVPKAA